MKQSPKQKEAVKIPTPAQESAQKKGVMPVSNPTGNPFPLSIKLPHDIEAL